MKKIWSLLSSEAFHHYKSLGLFNSTQKPLSIFTPSITEGKDLFYFILFYFTFSSSLKAVLCAICNLLLSLIVEL